MQHLVKQLVYLEATFFVHLTGTVILIILTFVLKLGSGNIGLWLEAPWYSWLGGLVSVFIIYLVAMSIPEAGVANATTSIIVGQVLTAVLIDHFGGFGMAEIPFGWSQFEELLLMAAEAKLLLCFLKY
jgi:transporter family-2 protein